MTLQTALCPSFLFSPHSAHNPTRLSLCAGSSAAAPRGSVFAAGPTRSAPRRPTLFPRAGPFPPLPARLPPTCPSLVSLVYFIAWLAVRATCRHHLTDYLPLALSFPPTPPHPPVPQPPTQLGPPCLTAMRPQHHRAGRATGRLCTHSAQPRRNPPRRARRRPPDFEMPDSDLVLS